MATGVATTVRGAPRGRADEDDDDGDAGRTAPAMRMTSAARLRWRDGVPLVVAGEFEPKPADDEGEGDEEDQPDEVLHDARHHRLHEAQRPRFPWR